MITIDMVKAKDIAHSARRTARNKAFAPLDVKATIPSEAAKAEADRAAIRVADSALQIQMDAATTAEELKALMPVEV